MEIFKIRNFEAGNPPETFPQFRSLSDHEMALIREELSRQLLPVSASLLDLVNVIEQNENPIPGHNADSDSFVLSELFDFLGLKPKESVFINWNRFDKIDEMRFEDLVKHFSDIWYPGPDDIDIFDSTLEWIVSISHYGSVRFLNLRNRGGL